VDDSCRYGGDGFDERLVSRGMTLATFVFLRNIDFRTRGWGEADEGFGAALDAFAHPPAVAALRRDHRSVRVIRAHFKKLPSPDQR
jgi:hypothetical protein